MDNTFSNFDANSNLHHIEEQIKYLINQIYIEANIPAQQSDIVMQKGNFNFVITVQLT